MARESTKGELSAPSIPARRIGARVYAGELDGAMCPACAAHAGLEYKADDPEAPSIPNAHCSSQRGCRCAWL